MGKTILLIDTNNNSSFLIVKERENWSLPTIGTDNNVEEEFLKKYHIKINPITKEIIENNPGCKFIKYNTNDCNLKLDETKYYCGIINDIINKIQDKYQQKLLIQLTTKISIEQINDSFWLGIILSIEDKIDDFIAKQELSDFLLFFSSIFCDEVIKYKFGQIKNYNQETLKKLIDKLRSSYLKFCPKYNSERTRKSIKEMGINFNEYVFDITLILQNNKLIDTNFSTWSRRKTEHLYKEFNGIVLSPRKWIKNSFPQYNAYFEQMRKKYVDYYVSKFKKIEMKFEEKSYSSYKLLNNSLTADEKVYIIYRLGILKSVKFISDFFEEIAYSLVNIEEQQIIDFQRFILKIKATIIEMLWNDKNQNEIPFLNNALNNLKSKIDSKFFSVNRKCRNNIHYGFYHKLYKNDYDILNKYQDIYLDYIISEFEKNINYNFDFKYNVQLFLAKILFYFQ